MPKKLLPGSASKGSKANHRAVGAQLHTAHDELRHLLQTSTPERKWQQFFAANPFVLSRSLPLQLLPCDIAPLGRPGKSEPDFVIYPGSSRSHRNYGLIELKTPSARILNEPRRHILKFSAVAETAMAQLNRYDQDYDLFSPVTRAMSFSSPSHLFVIMGTSGEIEKLDADLKRQLRSLLAGRARILTFDELVQSYSQTLPPRVSVLVPNRSEIAAPEGAFIEFVGRRLPMVSFDSTGFQLQLALGEKYFQSFVGNIHQARSIALSPFGKANSNPRVYMATSMETAMSEARSWLRDRPTNELPPDRVLFREVMYSTKGNLCDARELFPTRERTYLSNYDLSQHLGQFLVENGVDGVLYPSRFGPGDCICIFRPACIQREYKGRYIRLDELP
ncbi:MAG TPA: Shedu anti-phage system protein SduA domain-containing protein [Rhizomicrobium sp.]|nr:Shedu anti-phage system protein SduA domain-containing protein [Rhizomicrobium sp.]